MGKKVAIKKIEIAKEKSDVEKVRERTKGMIEVFNNNNNNV